MPDKKKEVKKKNPEVTQQQVNALWDVIDKIQKDMDYIGVKVNRIYDRMGLE